MLLCAEKRGRFIPCRGGGTATTYYTDSHDVDEDSKNIINQGGAWPDAAAIGMMYRNMYDSSVNISSIFVASRLIYLS